MQFFSFDLVNMLVKQGDKVPIGEFHTSKFNVRANVQFGTSPEDRDLIEQLRNGEIVEPILARSEKEGFGVYVGRRRLMAARAAGRTHLIAGKDVIIEDVPEPKAWEDSLIENLDMLRKEIDPITRAKAFKTVVDVANKTKESLRDVAKRFGLAHSTLSDFIVVLELPEEAQQKLARGEMLFRDGVHMARLQQQDQKELIKTLNEQGMETFHRELERKRLGEGKRGIPKDKYIVLRVTFDTDADKATVQSVNILSKQLNLEPSDFAKQSVQFALGNISKFQEWMKRQPS